MSEEENETYGVEEVKPEQPAEGGAQDKFEKQKKTIHVLGTIQHFAFPIGLWTTIGSFILALTFNIVGALAFEDGTIGAKVFLYLAKGFYSLLGSFAIPCLIGAIVVRIILKKKKAENPAFKDSVDDFNVY